MATIAVQVGEAPELEAFLAQRIYEYNASATSGWSSRHATRGSAATCSLQWSIADHPIGYSSGVYVKRLSVARV